MGEKDIKSIVDLGDITGHTILVTVPRNVSVEIMAELKGRLDDLLSDAKSVVVVSEDVRIESQRDGDAAFAAMAYMIVHDFQVDVIVSARAELRRDGESGYRDNVSAIKTWADDEGYSTISRHAKNTLAFIDEPEETFNIDNI